MTGESSRDPFAWKAKDRDALSNFLERFHKQFPSDRHCIEELIRRLDLDRCKKCNSRSVSREFGARILRCQLCHMRSWVFAGTFFERMRRPSLHLGVIWLHDEGFVPSAKCLEEPFNASYSSVFNVLKRVRETAATLLMQSVDRVTIKAFNRVFCRRSRETPAGEHPSFEVVEASTTASDSVDSLRNSQSEGFASKDATMKSMSEVPPRVDTSLDQEQTGEAEPLSPTEKSIFEALSTEPMSFDAIIASTGKKAAEVNVALTMLEFSGLAQRLPGDRYVLMKPVEIQPRERAENLSSVFKICGFVKHFYGGISRKYLQSYIASFWMSTDQAYWSKGRLFEVVLKVGANRKLADLLYRAPYVSVPPVY